MNNKFILLLATILVVIITILLIYYYNKPISVKSNEGVIFEKFNGYTKTSTDSFSFILSNKWSIEGKEGTILASQKGLCGPFIIINYVETPKKPTQLDKDWLIEYAFANKLETRLYRQKTDKEIAEKNRIADYYRDDAHIRKTYMEEEILDCDNKNSHVICTILSDTITSRTFIEKSIILKGTCEQTKAEFEEIENSFVFEK